MKDLAISVLSFILNDFLLLVGFLIPLVIYSKREIKNPKLGALQFSLACAAAFALTLWSSNEQPFFHNLIRFFLACLLGCYSGNELRKHGEKNYPYEHHRPPDAFNLEEK